MKSVTGLKKMKVGRQDLIAEAQPCKLIQGEHTHTQHTPTNQYCNIRKPQNNIYEYFHFTM